MGKLFNGLIIPLIGVIAIIAAIATSNEFLVIVAIFGGLCLLVIIIAALMNKSNKEERRLAENRRQQEEAYKNFRPATAVPGEAAGPAEPEVEVVMLGEKKNIKCTYTAYPLGDIAGGNFKAELQGDKPERHKVLKNYNKTLLECDVQDIVERWDRTDEKRKEIGKIKNTAKTNKEMDKILELNVPKENGGYVYTIKEVLYTTFSCSRNCIYYNRDDIHCSYFDGLDKMGISHSLFSFSAIKVLINVKNHTDSDEWKVGAEDVVMVDTDGFSYKGVLICEECNPPRMLEKWDAFLPHTQSNYIQLFPKPDNNAQIAKFRININGKWTDVLCTDIPTSIDKEGALLRQGNGGCEFLDSYSRMKLDGLRTKINDVRTDIFSRFNNELTRSEKVRIDNRITRNLYNVEVEAQTRKEREFVEIQKEVEKIRTEYYELLNGSSEEISVSGKDLGLFDMTPREFEVFSADLLGKMGYVDVELTQYTNDKGVDIIAYKGDVRYAVQCKRYKEPVGSPDMQKFIGAMMHAKADKGLFITTSRFTREAERMAAEHPIELIDRFKIPILLKDK